MARHRAGRAPEHHAPGRVGGRAPQLAVDEVRATAEQKAERRADATEVGQREVRDVGEPRRHDARQQGADQAAVEAHAPLVEREDQLGVLEVVAFAVEQDVAEAPAHDDADDDAEHDGEQRVHIHAHAPATRDAPDDETGEDEAQHIGDAVPAHGERPEGEEDGIDGLVDVVEHVVPSSPARGAGLSL